jgi:hypothetical protein
MKAYTLIDITETKQHRSRCTDKFLLEQQANFMSFFQTLSLRFNPYYERSPEVVEMDEKELKKLGFGNKYKGKHKVWCFDFTLDSATSSFIHDEVAGDFDLVPVIGGLNETIEINNNVFRTLDKNSINIVFKASE